eukprot:TRINITY_DN10138_c0_g1_i1.p1 TRINITY_DN10138_c0_g1~~TRINITY_DN10138_c0_g1_i1.p1  ORF type:complete len:933 (+),score=138.95 TRINITY_DN10138_c0_g1_i1:405-2801(+)
MAEEGRRRRAAPLVSASSVEAMTTQRPLEATAADKSNKDTRLEVGDGDDSDARARSKSMVENGTPPLTKTQSRWRMLRTRLVKTRSSSAAGMSERTRETQRRWLLRPKLSATRSMEDLTDLHAQEDQEQREESHRSRSTTRKLSSQESLPSRLRETSSPHTARFMSRDKEDTAGSTPQLDKAIQSTPIAKLDVSIRAPRALSADAVLASPPRALAITIGEESSDDEIEDGIATVPVSPAGSDGRPMSPDGRPGSPAFDLPPLHGSYSTGTIPSLMPRDKRANSDPSSRGLAPPSPVRPADSATPGHLQRSIEGLQNDQILLGAVAVKHRAAPDIKDLVDDLDTAGIRFVYFSAENELQSKAFAEEIGLETGWNCFISLSENAEDQEYIVNHAQLPTGVNNIRQHLLDVDNVPLLVPLFSDSSPSATQEMLLIMQENDMSVCAVGSSLHSENIIAFARADVSLSVIPERASFCLWPRERLKIARHTLKPRYDMPRLAVESAEELSAALTSLPCTLSMRRHDDVRINTLVVEARRLTINLTQMLTFLMFHYLLLSLLQLAVHACLLPPIFSGLQVVWLVVFVIPALAISMLFTPAERALIKLHTSRAKDRITSMSYLAVAFTVRCFSTGVVCALVFGFALHELCQDSGDDCHTLFGNRDGQERTWNDRAEEDLQVLTLAQNIAIWLFTFYMTIASSSYLHRVRGIHRFNPFRNQIWTITAILTLGLQTTYFVVVTGLVGKGRDVRISHVSTELLTLPLVWIAAVIVLNETFKAYDSKREQRDQKRARLEFGTKLGMHSPV